MVSWSFIHQIDDAHPLFDMMAITLEELPPVAIVSRATIGSLLILAHIISMTVHSHSQVVGLSDLQFLMLPSFFPVVMHFIFFFCEFIFADCAP